jgi:carboxypeptidase-like protein
LNNIFYTIAFYILSVSVLHGQTTSKERYIQVSGIITDDEYWPVPGVAVISKKLHRGTLSENSGIYSITSTPGDTIFFRALGFKRYHTIIPESFEGRHGNVDIVLQADTIQIEEVTILPWKTYYEFIQDITKEKPVDPLVENMNENLESIYVALANQTGVKVTAEAGYRYAMMQNFNAMTTKSQYPVNNLFNPFAWSKFIKGVQHGLFKNQKFNKPVKSKVRKRIKKLKNK